MATVYVGSARSDENGKASGGRAGDQTGRELMVQPWYNHSLGWFVLRAKDDELRALIARNARAACDNDLIGYDQGQRNDLYNGSASFGYDAELIKTPTEADCSHLVRACVAYAAQRPIPDFYTGTEKAVLMATGLFELLTESKYTASSTLLKAGYILCTNSKGHTVVVLNDGSKVTYAAGERPALIKGATGDCVREAQRRLIAHGFALPKYGADGDFGAESYAAVKAFQSAKGLRVSGAVTPRTWAALLADPTAAEAAYSLTVAKYKGGSLSKDQALSLKSELALAGYEAAVVEVK